MKRYALLLVAFMLAFLNVSMAQTQAINIPGNLHTKAIPIKGVNLKTLDKISSNLNKQPWSYNFILNSCSSVGSRALISAGYFAIGGIHPTSSGPRYC